MSENTLEHGEIDKKTDYYEKLSSIKNSLSVDAYSGEKVTFSSNRESYGFTGPNQNTEVHFLWDQKHENGSSTSIVSIEMTTLKANIDEIRNELGLKSVGLDLKGDNFEIQRSLRFEGGKQWNRQKAREYIFFDQTKLRINQVGQEKKKGTLATLELDEKETDKILNTINSVVQEKKYVDLVIPLPI